MTAVQDTIIIVEVLDAPAGRVYNGTLAPRDNVEQVAMALTSYPCN